MTASGLIFDIKKYSINDGPGIRTTVFFQGCPLACQWCHNPESQPSIPVLMVRANRCGFCGECVKVCPTGSISLNSKSTTDRSTCTVCGACVDVCYNGAREVTGYQTSVGEVMAAIERDRPFYESSGGGVTFSGGEPLLQPGFLAELLAACHDKGIHTAVDTSGFAAWETFECIRTLVDLFLYDLKLMEDARHKQFTGVSNQVILRNLQQLSKQGQALKVRIPLIPGINDDEDNLRQSADFLHSLPNLREVELLAYHASAESKYDALGLEYPLAGLKQPSQETMNQAKDILAAAGLPVRIG